MHNHNGLMCGAEFGKKHTGGLTQLSSSVDGFATQQYIRDPQGGDFLSPHMIKGCALWMQCISLDTMCNKS